MSHETGAETKRLIRALKGMSVDQTPIWLMRQAGRYLPEYKKTRAEAGSFLDLCYNPDLAEEVTLQPIRRYGFDAAILFSDILVIPDALGQTVSFREGEGPVLDPITRLEQLDELDTGSVLERLQPVYETVRRLKASLPAETALIGFAGAPWTVATYMVGGRTSSDQAAAKLWAYRAPEAFQKLIDILTEATILHLTAQVEAGAEIVQIFDTWAGSLPEAQFRTYSIAPTKKIIHGLRAKFPGLPVIGFPRGAGALAIDYVRSTEISGVSLDTGMSPAWARDNLQTLACLQGNLDPLLLVAGGAEMREAATRILKALSHGPFIFNLGHGIVPQTPPDHVAELVEFIRAAK
ncbi:uroporphyrinogen decarboxylase [Parvibaculum sp.]|uniref:uroporphyrinogen decarboxylase n=1 Tax=Parvibaculum sp. TaxID=2024848 RepID=UPI002C08BF63|nr:uroporphyrinogen decarboxylase [Parvibaculum sp.]HUD50350.1 uroporphyrinogen decarboxylase [Parvibaculum sp.]